MSGTSILSATKPNPGSHREAASVGKEIWNSAICHREGIKRILDWHTDAEWTKAEWVDRKRNSRKGCVEK